MAGVGGGRGAVKRNRSLDSDMSMVRALDEYQHQDSRSRVEINHTWQKGPFCFNSIEIWKRSFCLKIKGKVKSKVELGDVIGKLL